MFPVSNEFTIYWAANKKFQFVSKNQYPYVCVVGRLNSSFLWCATKKLKFFAELWTRKIVDCWKFDNFFYLFHNVGFPFVSLGLSEFFPSQKNFLVLEQSALPSWQSVVLLILHFWLLTFLWTLIDEPWISSATIFVKTYMLTLVSWRFLVLGEVSFCISTLPNH